MIKFTKLPVTQGFPKKPVQNKVDIGMDTHEFHKQVMGLIAKKVPVEKAFEAIDKHADIKDKPRAKSMCEAIYKILGKS